MNEVKEKKGPYGDKPFIYAGDLSLHELISWLSQELKRLKDRQSALRDMEDLAEKLAQRLDEVVDCALSERLKLPPESDLMKDTQQCQQLIESLSHQLHHSGLFHDDFPGSGLPEEHKKAIKNGLSRHQYGKSSK